MDVTFKVNQLFKKDEEEEEEVELVGLLLVFTRSSFRRVGLYTRTRVRVLVRFLNVTRKKVEKAIQKDAVALNHKLVHLPEEFFFLYVFIFFCVECRFVIF